MAIDIVLFPVQVIRGDRPYGPYADEPTVVRGYLTGSGFRDYQAGGQSKDEAAKGSPFPSIVPRSAPRVGGGFE